MLPVTPKSDVADSHLLRLPGGFTAVIDAGLLGDSPGAVVNALKAEGVQRIDLMVISHFHIDHYGAMIDVIDAGIPIGRVAVNVPDKAAADPERPWGCNLDHVRHTLDELGRRQTPWFTPTIGQTLWEGQTPDGTRAALEVVALYDGLNTPIGRTDVNDTSIILRLSVGQTRALFTGDLNAPLGSYLAQSADFDLKADLLKVPHHGTEGAAPNTFFDRVGAKAALVPAPRDLWESDRSARFRDYFAAQGVPTYVSGINGSVTVTFTSNGYEIATER